jgi:hypothetical protein
LPEEQVADKAQEQQPPAQAQPDAAALQAQIDQLKSQVAEKEQAAQYWHQQAKGAAPPPKQTADEPEEDVLDLITRKGPKGLEELIAKRGYVKKDDVDSMIKGTIQTTIAEMNLKSQYPDLKDQNSDFFKATSKEYAALVQQGVAPHVAMGLAADKAELAELRAGKRKIETDKDRDARIKAQSPEGIRRTSKKDDEEGDDSLSEEQKFFAEKLGVSEDAYKKQAKAGIRLGGRSAR